ncbi:hypothetical protein [Flavobacterium salmonis]|nr:hypothetical protein [Flavobacterium salmonis]
MKGVLFAKQDEPEKKIFFPDYIIWNIGGPRREKRLPLKKEECW